MFFLLMAAALGTATIVLPAPGIYRYEVVSGAKTIGKNELNVRRTALGTKIEESGSAHLETGDSSAKSSMLLDQNLNIAAYDASYTSLEQTMKTVVTIAGREATMVAGTDKRIIALGGSSKGFVILDAALVSGFFALPAQMRVRANGDATVLIPGTGASAFIDVIPEDRPARPPEVPQSDESLSFAGELPFVEWFDPRSLVVDEISLPGQNVTIHRAR